MATPNKGFLAIGAKARLSQNPDVRHTRKKADQELALANGMHQRRWPFSIFQFLHFSHGPHLKTAKAKWIASTAMAVQHISMSNTPSSRNTFSAISEHRPIRNSAIRSNKTFRTFGQTNKRSNKGFLSIGA